MSALDIALTVILSYFLIRGVFRGLVKEIVGILGLFVAFWAASVYWPAGAEQLKVILDDYPSFRAILSFMVIFLIVYFLVGLMSIFIDKIVKMTITPFASGLLGGVLGVLKGVVLCLILLTATTIFLVPNHIFYTDSVVWPTVEPWCVRVKSWFPERLQEALALAQKAAPTATRPPSPAGGAPRIQPGLAARPTDFASLQALVRANPQLFSQAWREKIESLAPEEFNADLLRRFMQENRAVFASQPGAVQTGPAQPGAGGELAPPPGPTQPGSVQPGQPQPGQAQPNPAQPGQAQPAPGQPASTPLSTPPGPLTWSGPAED